MKFYSILLFAFSAIAFSGCFPEGAGDPVENLDFAALNSLRKEKLSTLAEQEKQISTPEQIKYDQMFGKKINAARRLVWQKKYAEAESNLKSLMNDLKASPSLRSGIPVILIDSLLRRNRNFDVPDTVDSYLKQNALSSRDRAALLQQKALAFDRMKKYPEKFQTLLERLKEPISENEAKWTRSELIRTAEEMRDLPLAIRCCRESLRDPDLNEKDKIALQTRLTGLCRTAKMIPETLAETEKLFHFLTRPEDRAGILLANANMLDTGKKKDKAKKIRMDILSDPVLPFKLRWSAFRAIADPLRNGKNKTQIIPLANATLLNSKLSPADFGTVVSYLMDVSGQYLRQPEYARKYAASLLTYPDVPNKFKIKAVRHIAAAELDAGRFDEAGKRLEEALTFPALSGSERLEICQSIAESYVAAFQCDRAVAFLRSKQTPENKAKIAEMTAGVYEYFLRDDEAAQAYLDANMPEKAVALYAKRHPDKAKTLACRIIADEKKPDTLRASMILQQFSSGSGEDKALREKYSHLLEQFAQPRQIPLRNAVTFGDYPLLIEYWDLLEKLLAKNKQSLSYEQVSGFLQTCAATEATGRAASLVKQYANFEKFTPEQRRIIAFAGPLLTLPDKPGEFEKYRDSSPVLKDPFLTNKERSTLFLEAATLALNARKNILAEAAHQAYLTLFKPEPQKTYTLNFSDAPIRGLAGFLAMEDQPEKQKLDRKFGGNMDFLSTDVSTGQRGSGIGSKNKEKFVPTDFQAVCDEYGIHFLFTAHDPAAPEIEAGLSGAGSFEMYLAPGENQPYMCFLPDLTTGLNKVWNTTYDNALWRRLDPGVQKLDVRSERIFTADGYRFYLFLSWEKFYDKLPEPGDLWDFENIHWSRFGGYSWNGIKTIHGRSTWGKLAFRIGTTQMVKIKRHILFAARRNYLNEKITSVKAGIIDFWKDPLLGDPAFFNEKVAPVVEKLDSFLPFVNAGMDADAVEKIFCNAVPGWFGIRFILSDLRRRYLEEKLTE